MAGLWDAAALTSWTPIFEPCFRTKSVGQGTGLGLSQVFGFARQLGGHVALRSTPGHGIAITLSLPEFSIESTKGAE